jgi:hypothetical protein
VGLVYREYEEVTKEERKDNWMFVAMLILFFVGLALWWGW